MPLPSVGLHCSSSIFATQEEREEGRQYLERLNTETQSLTTSDMLQKSFDTLKELLKPEGLAQL